MCADDHNWIGRDPSSDPPLDCLLLLLLPPPLYHRSTRRDVMQLVIIIIRLLDRQGASEPIKPALSLRWLELFFFLAGLSVRLRADPIDQFDRSNQLTVSNGAPYFSFLPRLSSPRRRIFSALPDLRAFQSFFARLLNFFT